MGLYADSRDAAANGQTHDGAARARCAGQMFNACLRSARAGLEAQRMQVFGWIERAVSDNLKTVLVIGSDRVL